VVSLEPDPRLFSILQANVRRNGLSQIIPLQVAAGDKAGTLTLSGYSDGAENRGVSRIVSDASSGPVFRVNAECLDAVLTRCGLDRIDLLKVDIEGAEGIALAGLDRALSDKHVRRLLLELHPEQLREQGILIEQVLCGLIDAGYRGWVVDHSPETTRRACYGGVCDPRSLLRPFDLCAKLDSWPHLLWTAPGMGPLL
jgi:FkbM family methyltransferase